MRVDRPVASEAVDLGPTVQTLRQQRGLTLTQLSERSGISPSALSKIERSKLSPTYANLVRLARGLEVDIGALFANSGLNGSSGDIYSIMKLDEGEIISAGSYLHYYLHMKQSDRAMVPILTYHFAKSLDEFGPLVSHTGEEFAYVVSGVVEVHVEGRPPVQLHQGESIYFDSKLPHAYLAASESPCRTLCICTNVGFDELKAVTNAHLTSHLT